MSLAPYIGNTGGVQWEALGEEYFRKSHLFHVGWPYTFPSLQPGSFSLDGLLVSCAPLGGAIAMIKDDGHIVHNSDGEPDTRAFYEFNHKLSIFSSSGKLLSQFPVDHHNILSIQWDHNDNIACILEDGQVVFYNVHGHLVMTQDFGSQCMETGITDVSSFQFGAVARACGTNNIFYLSFSTSLVHKYPDARLKKTPQAVALLPFNPYSDELDMDAVPHVLVSAIDGRIVKLMADSTLQADLDTGVIIKIGSSICGSHIALFSSDGTVYGTDCELSRIYHRFETKSQVPPMQLGCIANDTYSEHSSRTQCLATEFNTTACTSHTVFAVWNHPPPRSRALCLLLADGAFVSHTFPSHVVVAHDVDGIRIVSESACELIQCIPAATRTLFDPSYSEITDYSSNPTDIEPAALLLVAHLCYTRNDAHVETIISNLRQTGSLSTAIEQCLDALQYETDPNTRTMIMQAIAFGRLNIDVENDISPDSFVEACKNVRVVTQLGNTDYGFPLISYLLQLSLLPVDLLINRLISRNQHLLAFRIAEHLRVDPGPVVEDLCIRKIVNASSSTKDSELCLQIVDKYKMVPQLSFNKVATCAVDNLRPKLAISLIYHDKKPSNQISLLLSLSEWVMALDVATGSHDGDLVALVLSACSQHLSRVEFCRVVNERPLAHHVYLQTCEEQDDLEALRVYYNNTQSLRDAAQILMRQAYLATDLNERLVKLRSAKELFDSDKSFYTMSALVKEQLDLLQVEMKLENEFQESFIDNTTHGVLQTLVTMRQDVKVNKLKSQLKVSDQHAEYIEVYALADMKSYEALAQKAMASRRGPLIGYEPYIEACIRNGNKFEAARYVHLLSDTTEQLEWFCNLGLWQKAIDVAVKDRDLESLETIRVRCKQADVQAQIDGIIRDMK